MRRWKVKCDEEKVKVKVKVKDLRVHILEEYERQGFTRHESADCFICLERVIQIAAMYSRAYSGL